MTTPSEPAGGRLPYDLSTAAHDFPEWEGPPRRTVLICTHPRSGSTLLGEALYFAGGFGCPLEYFHRGFRPGLAKRWGSMTLDAHVRAVHRFRTDPSGVLSVKLFWRDIEDLAAVLAPERFADVSAMQPTGQSPERYREIGAMLDGIFPNAVYVHLRRSDRIRQAVSSLVAIQTGLWRVVPQMGEQAPAGAPGYDFDRIAGFIRYSDFCHGHWHHFFAASGLTPHALTYEELSDDYHGAVARLLARLGGAGSVPRERIQQQSDAVSEAFVLRYLREQRERGSQATANGGAGAL